jgi:hypothetical protein
VSISAERNSERTAREQRENSERRRQNGATTMHHPYMPMGFLSLYVNITKHAA